MGYMIRLKFIFLQEGINPLLMPLLFNSDGDTGGSSSHLPELPADANFGRAVGMDMQLHYACANGDPVNVRSCLESKRFDVNSKDYCGRTPLHVACTCKSAGAKEVVHLLLNHGGDANLVDNVGMTCMDIVIKGQNLSIRKVLEGKGIECDQCIPLHSALEQKARESSWLLKASDLELKREIGHTLKSVVHLADWHGSLVVVKCVKMQHHVMMRQLRMSNSLRLSHAVEDSLDTAETEPSTPDGEIGHDGTEELLHEIQLLSTLRHPDLVLFLGACLEPGMPTMFVTEYMHRGDLEHYLYNMREEKQVAHYVPPFWRTMDWCSAIARALAFLHRVPVIHRDLKPLNLLLTKTLDVKVTDFGTSRLAVRRDDEDPMAKCCCSMTIGVGTCTYMAPEVVRTKDYNEKVDIYSFSLIMFYLSSGKRPFYHLGGRPMEILDRFLSGEEPRPDANECHKVLRGLMKQCWAVKPDFRPSAEEVLHHLQGMNGNRCGCPTM